MRNAMLAGAAALFVLSACDTVQPVPADPAPLYQPANAAGAPILAAFEGRIPCLAPGCEKTKVTLVLYEGPASRTYWLATVNVGAGDDRRTVNEGTWVRAAGIKDYPQAQVFRLDENAPEALRRVWRVSDDVLLPLDAAMRPRAGNASWGYMLSQSPRQAD